MLPIHGDWLMLTSTYSLAYDSLNGVLVGDRTPGITPSELRARFAHIRAAARKYAPHRLPFIDAVEKIALKNQAGRLSDHQALAQMRQLAQRNGVNAPIMKLAEMQVAHAEAAQRSRFVPKITRIRPPRMKLPQNKKRPRRRMRLW